jgi:hypothetical protein
MIIYLDESWIPQHATIALFEVQETSGNADFTTLRFVRKYWINPSCYFLLEN